MPSLAWLAHHVLVHPIVGVLHFAGDLALWSSIRRVEVAA